MQKKNMYFAVVKLCLDKDYKTICDLCASPFVQNKIWTAVLLPLDLAQPLVQIG